MASLGNSAYVKYQRLQQSLARVGRSMVAFSGGANSALLLWSAAEAVGREQVLAVTDSPEAEPTEAAAEAERIARRLGIPYRLLPWEGEGEPASWYTRLAGICREDRCTSLLAGYNASRPARLRFEGGRGARLGVRCPLAEAGLKEGEVQALARALGLVASPPPAPESPTPAVVPSEALAAAEAYLRGIGFARARVWLDGETARIELAPEEVARVAIRGVRLKITERMRELGLPHAAIALPEFPPAYPGAPQGRRFPPR